MLTLEDLERRAKARGWTVSLPVYTQTVLVYDDVGWLATYRRLARFPPEQWWWCAEAHDPMVQAYLDGVLASREGAARVLAVVAQVAAMTAVERAYRMQIEGLYQLTNTFARRARGERHRADDLRREVLRLRARIRSFSEVHPAGDRLRPDDLDALLYRANLAQCEQVERTDYLARELRGRREHGASAFGWPRGMHGPKGRLP